jgi:hypothetical protein
MKKLFPLLILNCFAIACFATNGLKPLAKKIAEKKMQQSVFAEKSLFSVSTQASGIASQYAGVVKEALILDLSPAAVSSLLTERPENISFVIPGKNEQPTVLELYRAEIFTPDFSVVTSGNGIVDVPTGLHYRGIIRGDNKSLAAISIFDGEVMGLVSSPATGNMVLGKLKDDAGSNHIYYNDKDLVASNELKCLTTDDAEGYSPDQLQSPSQSSVNCIRIYWELNYDIYQDKGSVANATNYATGLFNESATLYTNDNIPVELSQVFVWNTASPYTGTIPPQLLNQFQAYRNSFNGDLAHLLGYAGGGGIAAGFNGFCAADPDNSQCFSGVDGTFQNVPVFSWSVEVVTHEQGHLMGSRHTHACVWNGNNTAIDACGPTAGYPYEGNCNGASLPSNGGTVMSYCHLLPTGINFTNGFGAQPATVILNNFILNNYNNASCLSACTGGSFCAASSNTSTINVTTTTADFLWESVSGAVSYNVQYRIVGTVVWSADTSLDTSYHAVALSPGSNYEWQVQTVCAGGTSIFTSSAYFITIPLSCDPPSALTTTNISAAAADFNWNAVPGAVSYNIQYRIVGAAVWSTGSTTATTYHVTGLTSLSNYEWQVQTVCVGGGISPFSNLQFFTTLDIGAMQTIIFQPDAECGKDALLSNNVPLGNNVTNFGWTPEFNGLAWTASGNISDHRSMLQFDLTSIPEGSIVQTALLSLYWNPTSSNIGHSQLSGLNDATLSEIDAPWDEFMVTWMNQPATTTQNQVYLPASSSNTQDYINIDVTAMIQGFVNDPLTNYGMMLKTFTETAWRSLIFCSSDHADPTKRPRLEVTFSPNVSECKRYQYSNCMGTDAVVGNCILAGDDTSNYGFSPDLDIMAWTYSGTESNIRSLLQWNLAEIPVNAVIDSALLSLYWNPTSVNTGHSTMSGPNDSYIFKITSAWSENTVTWNTQPTTTAVGQVYLPASTSSTEDFMNINVTQVVQDWVTNPAGNFGILMQLATETNWRSLTFCSSDHADPARHPRLDVCYHLSTGVSGGGTNAVRIFEDFHSRTLNILSTENFSVNSILQIYNCNGQLVRRFDNLSGNSFVMNKGDLSSGVYFYRLSTGEKTENGKIIF